VSDDNTARRLIGDDKIQVAGVLDFVNGSNNITDIKIGLKTNLTRLTNYYSKTKSNTSLALKAPLASPAFTGKIDVNGTATSYLEAAHDGNTGSIDLQNTGIYLYTVSDDNLDSASISAEQGILTFGTNYGEIYYDNLGLQIGMNGADSVNRLEVLGNTINPLTVNGNTTAFAGTVNFGSSTISNLSYSSLSIPVYNAISDLPAAADNHGRWAHVHGEGAMYFAHGGSWVQSAVYPSQSGQSGKFLTTNGTTTSWAEVSGGGGTAGADIMNIMEAW